MDKSIYVQRLDKIQSEIGRNLLKPNGFKKKGRSFNRETVDHLVQVIAFQIGQSYFGDSNKFSVHIGIRVPESFEKTFGEPKQIKNFYQCYDCNIVTCLNNGTLGYSAYKSCNGVSYNAKMFLLDSDDIQPVADEISQMIEKQVLPYFDDMDTREKVLVNRTKYHAKYKEFELSNTIDLDEAMIYGHAGNIKKATQIIQNRYDFYNNEHHKEYLENLSKELGIALITKHTQ